MSVQPVTIIGSYLSPYVRKVLVCLGLKGIPYHIDPIVPFFGNDAFSRLSPVRRVPVLIDPNSPNSPNSATAEPGSDGPLTLADSTVICEYLEDRYPDPALLPRDPAQRARARWLEEFADTRMGEVFIWQLFNQLVINRFVWGRTPDAAIVDRAHQQELPAILDYLEAQLPASGFIFGSLSLADIALASPFRNAAMAKWTPDRARWPQSAAFVERTLAHPAFAALKPFEELCRRTPITQHRDALRSAGAPIAETTYGTDTPRRGILRTDGDAASAT